MLGRRNIFKAPRATAQIGHGLLGDMGRVAVQHHADDGLLEVVLIELLEQVDEFDAWLAVLDLGKDVPRMQVDAPLIGIKRRRPAGVWSTSMGGALRRLKGSGQGVHESAGGFLVLPIQAVSDERMASSTDMSSVCTQSRGTNTV